MTSRRDFLRASAGAAVSLPYILTSTALGQGNTPPASERLLLGAVGVRNQGLGLVKSMVREIVAVCDVDQNVLAAAKKTVEDATGRECAAYGDYRQLLERDDLNGVVIATPDHWHALIAVNACEAGKDVYCEKPLSLTVADGQAMVGAARRYERIVQTGSQQRSSKEFRTACELVRSGKIGVVHTVKVGIPGVNFQGPPVPDSDPPPELSYDFWLGPAPLKPYNAKHVHYNFRFFWDYSGGQLTNWGAHHLDIAQWGLGMDESGPVAIEGTAGYNADGWFEVPEWMELTYEYANGVKLLCGRGQRGGTTFEGESGSIWVNRGKLESDPPELITQPLGEDDVHLYESNSHRGNWYDCIRSRKLPICDVAIGHRSATVCHLGNIAIRTGRKITWDPASEQIVGDDEAAAMLSRPYRAPWHLP